MTTGKQELTRSAPSPEQLAPASGQTAARPQPGPRVLRHKLALDDFETAARSTIPRPIYGYITGRAETNASRRPTCR